MNAKLIRSLALLGFFAGASVLSIVSADAQMRPTLRASVSVTGDVVTLGDLVADAGTAGAQPMFRAPQAGERGTIQASRVLAAAREAGLAQVDSGGVQQIVVERAVRRMAKQDIDDFVAGAIADRTRLDARELLLSYDSEPALLLPQGEKPSIAVSDLVLDTRLRRFNAVLAVAGSGKSLRVAGSYSEAVLVPVLARGLQKGDAIRDSDFVMERRDRESIGEDAVTEARTLVGRVARNAMRAGLVLRDRDLVRPIVVERNAMITMQLDVPGIQITMKGKAMEQGAIGELISVQNLNSKRTVQGIVTGANQVRIGANAAAMARTAEAAR